jgi:hypothetical protein
MRAGLVPDVGSKAIAESPSIPFIDRSTGSGLPVAAPLEVGAIAEKADALVAKAARTRVVQNFMLDGALMLLRLCSTTHCDAWSNRQEHIEATGNFVPLCQKSQLQLGCLSTNMGGSKRHHMYTSDIYVHIICTNPHGSKEVCIWYVCMYRTGMIYVYVHMYLVGTLSYR